MNRSKYTLVRGTMILTLLPAAALLLAPLSLLADDDEWVEVTGEAAIVGDNEVHAREMAQQQALRQAVDMVAGTIVSGISESRQYIAVRDEITSQGTGYVRRFEVKGTECSGGTCKVTVRALVSKQGLSQRLSDIGLLVQRRGYPRVVLLVQEQNVGEERPGLLWSSAEVRPQIFENTLSRHLNLLLTDHGDCQTTFKADDECWTPLEPGMRFRVMDYRSVSAVPVVQQAQAGVDLTDAQYQELARLTDAEIAIVGLARVTDRGDSRPGAGSVMLSGPAYHALYAEASVRVIAVNSGESIGSATVRSYRRDLNVQRGGEILLQSVARQAAVEVQRVVAEKWGSEETGGRWVRLEIDGLGSFNDLLEFQTHLRTSVTGVRSVQQRRMDGSSAHLDVETSISAEQLATELATRPVGRFSVRITKVDSAAVGVHLGN